MRIQTHEGGRRVDPPEGSRPRLRTEVFLEVDMHVRAAAVVDPRRVRVDRRCREGLIVRLLVSVVSVAW